MSMHLVGPQMTTTSYKKREEKITKAKQTQLESDWRSRNVRLREMGLPKETFEQFMEWVYGYGKKEKTQKNSRTKIKSPVAAQPVEENYHAARPDTSYESIHEDVPPCSLDKSRWAAVLGGCTKKPSPVYTGTKILGIATMHKSNSVPVFSNEEAVEISRMRR